MQDKQNRAPNVGPLLNVAGDLVKKNMEKTKVYNAFFILLVTGKTGLQESQAPET